MHDVTTDDRLAYAKDLERQALEELYDYFFDPVRCSLKHQTALRFLRPDLYERFMSMERHGFLSAKDAQDVLHAFLDEELTKPVLRNSHVGQDLYFYDRNEGPTIIRDIDHHVPAATELVLKHEARPAFYLIHHTKAGIPAEPVSFRMQGGETFVITDSKTIPLHEWKRHI